MTHRSRYSPLQFIVLIACALAPAGCFGDAATSSDPDLTEPPGCRSSGDCAAGERCEAATGECVGRVPDLVFVLEITDTTVSEDGACKMGSSGAPGSDIMSVQLVIDGEPPGGYWAKAIHWTTTPAEDGENRLANPPQHLVGGVAPAYDISAAQCPDEFVDETVMSLGCGGKLWVEFRDRDGFRAQVPTDGSANVWVYEYGDMLCSRSARDQYKVEMCAISKDEIVAATSPDDIDCRAMRLIDDEAGVGRALHISGPRLQ